MTLNKRFVFVLGAVLLGCSDPHSAEDSESVQQECPCPKVDAAKELVNSLRAKNVVVGWDRNRETITSVQSVFFNAKFRETDSGDDSIDRYDFELPVNAGECSRLAFAFWKAYARALAAIAESANTMLSAAEQKKFGLRGDSKMSTAGAGDEARTTSMSASQTLCGLKVLEQVWAVDDARTHSCALAVQADQEFCSQFAKGGSYRPGRYTLKQKIDELLRHGAAIGPYVYVDKDGVLWRLGIVPVDLESTGMTSDWSMRLAFEFALRTVTVKIDSFQSVETFLDSENNEAKEKFNSSIRVHPMIPVEIDDAVRIRRFAVKANHPLLGNLLYNVCAIRD